MGEPSRSGGHDVEVAAVRSGEDLDWPRLESYLREQLPELHGRFDVLQFPNGSANLTYLVSFGDRKLVVRRPPFGQLAPGAHDMRREFRAVDALSKHYDRAPRATCSATTTASSGRTSSWSSTAAASWSGTTCRRR